MAFSHKMFFLLQERESLTIENNVGHFDGAYKLRFFFFGIHCQNTLRTSFCYYDDKTYVSVLVFIFSALTIS